MFDSMVVIYLFLGGAGAGACVLLSVMGLLVRREDATAVQVQPNRGKVVRVMAASRPYRRLFAPAYAVALVMVAIGALVLVLDLGVAGRTPLLFLEPHLTFLTFGAFALVALLAAALVLAYVWAVDSARWRWGFVRACQVACLLFGLGVVGYTGFLLSSMQAVPLWANGWVPVLFIASSLSCGCATVLMCACLSDSLASFRTTARHMLSVDLAVIVIEAIAAAGVVLAALSSPYEVAATGARELLNGEFAVLFIAGFGVVGIAFPALVEAGSLAAGRQHVAVMLCVATAVLVGGFILRYCIVAVGMHPAVWL